MEDEGGGALRGVDTRKSEAKEQGYIIKICPSVRFLSSRKELI